MFASVAAGVEKGGYRTIEEAAKNMARVKNEKIKPIAKNHAVYELLYAEYNKLVQYFGEGENDVMKKLKKLREGLVVR